MPPLDDPFVPPAEWVPPALGNRITEAEAIRSIGEQVRSLSVAVSRLGGQWERHDHYHEQIRDAELSAMRDALATARQHSETAVQQAQERPRQTLRDWVNALMLLVAVVAVVISYTGR